MTPLYDLRDVHRTYGTGDAAVHALAGVSLTVDPGELVVVAGPSGSGKSTLLQLLGALDRPTRGEVRFEGRDLRGLGGGELARLRRETLGFVFQQFNLIPTLTAAQNVEVALAAGGGRRRGARRGRVGELLARVGLAGRVDHLPSQLSGGEQQRVAIARAFANKPMILIADEPTGNLDPSTSVGIMKLLDRINRTGTTVVMATHDAAIVDSMRRRVVELSAGRVVRDQSRGVYGYGA